MLWTTLLIYMEIVWNFCHLPEEHKMQWIISARRKLDNLNDFSSTDTGDEYIIKLIIHAIAP